MTSFSGRFERLLRLPECISILELPCGVEVIRVVDVLVVIKIDDAVHAVLVSIGVGHNRMRRKRDSFRHQNQMFNHLSCRAEVLLSSAGDMVSDSPELSKPASFAESTGNVLVGRMSAPVRSRMV